MYYNIYIYIYIYIYILLITDNPNLYKKYLYSIYNIFK